jgi:putative FmdB family regulatory protein
MPIFDYACRECEQSFETLVLREADSVSCPVCGSADVSKAVSLFSCTTVQLNKRLRMDSEDKIRKGQEMVKGEKMRQRRIKIL